MKRLLDLFCGAGGATRGYQDAGFYVVGVDINPQPHYCGDEFYQADAMTFPLDGFDAVGASPPCQGYSVTRFQTSCAGKIYPLLIAATRERLIASKLPYVIENVSGAPMGHYITLCGTYFGLKIYRHRQFETSHLLLSPFRCSHPHKLPLDYCTIMGDHTLKRSVAGKRYNGTLDDGLAAMGIDWMMNQRELAQAIPPAYTRWIGQQLRGTN